MSNPSQLSTKKRVTLLSFGWGARLDAEPFGEERFEQELLLCDGTEPVTHLTRTYYPVPTMEISLPEDKSSIETVTGKIRLPLVLSGNGSFNEVIADLTSSNAFAPVTVKVRVLETPLASRPVQESIETWFDGIIVSTARYESDARNIVTIEICSDIGLLDVPIGLTLDPKCTFSFGGIGCQKANVRVPYHPVNRPSGLAMNVYVEIFGTSRDFRIWVYALDPAQNTRITTVPNGWWEKGYLERDGLRLTIREWNEGTNSFITTMPAPQAWFGTVFDRRPVLLVPGCEGFIEDCRLRGNEEHFGGAGKGIPDFNPVTGQGDR